MIPVAMGLSAETIIPLLAGMAVVPTLSKVNWKGMWNNNGDVEDLDSWVKQSVKEVSEGSGNERISKATQIVQNTNFFSNAKDKMKEVIKWMWDKIKKHPMFAMISASLLAVKMTLSKLGDSGLAMFAAILTVIIAGLFTYNIIEFHMDKKRVQSINSMSNINDFIERQFHVSNRAYNAVLDGFDDDLIIFKLDTHRNIRFDIEYEISGINAELVGDVRRKLTTMMRKYLYLMHLKGETRLVSSIFKDEDSDIDIYSFTSLSHSHSVGDVVEDVLFLNYFIPKTYVSVRDLKTLSKLYS